jgi:hypothetical protein
MALAQKWQILMLLIVEGGKWGNNQGNAVAKLL